MRVALAILALIAVGTRAHRFVHAHQRTVLRPSTTCALTTTRGGHVDYSDDDDEEKPIPKRTPSRQGGPSRGVSPKQAGTPRPPLSRRGGPPPRHRRPQPSALGTAANLARKTVDVTTAAAWGTIKGSGKAAFYLISPKHVSRNEIWGVWRLDQQVEDSDTTVSCAANVELTPRGDVIVVYEDQKFVTPFSFRERNWPQSCSIDFEARAFQGPNDEEPVLVRYKGTFRRKVADSSIVKIVGTIYEVKRKGMWKGQPRKIGTFVARRRIMKRQAPMNEEESEYGDEDEYEEEFEEDFENEEQEEEWEEEE